MVLVMVMLSMSGAVSGAHVAASLASAVAEVRTMLAAAAVFLAMRVESAALGVSRAALAGVLVVMLAAVVFAMELPAIALLVVAGLPRGVNGAAVSTAVVVPALPPARCSNVMDDAVSQANAQQTRSTSFVARLKEGVMEGGNARQSTTIHYQVVLPAGGSRPFFVVVVEAGNYWKHVSARCVADLVVTAMVKRRNAH